MYLVFKLLLFANIPCVKRKTHDLLQLGTSDLYLKKFDVVVVTETIMAMENTQNYLRKYSRLLLLKG